MSILEDAIIVFQSPLTMAGWTGLSDAAAARLLPIAESSGEGGLVALWRTPDGAIKFVVANDLDHVVIAETALEFLQLVASGHEEMQTFIICDEADEASAAAHAKFRDWVEETFDVEVPEAWDVEAKDEFTDWWLEQTTQNGRKRGGTENPDASAGQITVSGPISLLTGLIGTPDGADAAAKMSEVVGIDIGESVKKASRKLKGRGITVEVARGKIATMWIHVSIEDEGHFGSAPLVYRPVDTSRRAVPESQHDRQE